MKHLFVPYELAKLAKEKGFNEPCITYIDVKSKQPFEGEFMEEWWGCQNEVFGESPNCTAPLYQQLVDWFREKHGYCIFPYRLQWVKNKSKFRMRLHNGDGEPVYYTESGMYYEALTAALTKAFELI